MADESQYKSLVSKFKSLVVAGESLSGLKDEFRELFAGASQPIVIEGLKATAHFQITDFRTDYIIEFVNCSFANGFSLQHSVFRNLIFSKCKIEHLDFISNSSPGGLLLRECDVTLFQANNLAFDLVGISNSKISVLNITHCSLPSLRIDRTELHMTAFNGTNFQSSVFFGEVIFRTAPVFYNVTLPQATTFDLCQFLDTTPFSEAVYRQIKLLMAELQNEIEETNFAGLELRSRHSRLVWRKHPYEKLLSFCYKHINGFGRSIERPFQLLAAQLLISFALHAMLIEQNPTFWFTRNSAFPSSINLSTTSWVVGFWTAFAGALGPLKLIDNFNMYTPASMPALVVHWIEAVSSSLLWYLIIAGARRRFKTH